MKKQKVLQSVFPTATPGGITVGSQKPKVKRSRPKYSGHYGSQGDEGSTN